MRIVFSADLHLTDKQDARYENLVSCWASPGIVGNRSCTGSPDTRFQMASSASSSLL